MFSKYDVALAQDCQLNLKGPALSRCCYFATWFFRLVQAWGQVAAVGHSQSWHQAGTTVPVALLKMKCCVGTFAVKICRLGECRLSAGTCARACEL